MRYMHASFQVNVYGVSGGKTQECNSCIVLYPPKQYSAIDTNMYKAKSRKYQGVLKVKSRVKTWQVAQASPKGGRNQVSGRVSVPCWLATPVAYAPWKPLIVW